MELYYFRKIFLFIIKMKEEGFYTFWIESCSLKQKVILYKH